MHQLARLVPFALLATMWGHPAQAGAIRVTPVRVEVPAGRQFCALTVGNDAERPVTVQVRGFAWTRDENGSDTLDAGNAPVVNPAIVTIPKGESRLVRCSLPRDTTGGAAEQQWRLIVDELPQPSSEVAPGSVQTLLRLSVPVFRTPDKATPQLGWSVVRTGDGTPALRITNSGARRVQVVKVVMHLRSGQDAPLNRGFYLLAKGAMVLPVRPDIAHDLASVTADTDIGTMSLAPAVRAEGAPDGKLDLSQTAKQ
ncbi:fimbrial biogenesis chaperone [Novosphingobium cyanobacteriorum]|uniref:Fimbria/pilus periplasmic chaperone n=1 Tax=Novosphingobium cyanobacteriorum TaxID=3024215 RepID=A0ABT6CFP6_9SPHN|nr:fimbria/pilus periplasmic chaperone [Novosphingobium cyanobacteriorum]MDF8332743.1 fimbria/pilus periplasmic chaperone [Novosphingobium cyanobacteriorum]